MNIFKLSALYLVICVLCLLIVIDPQFGIRYTITSSLPYKVFISHSCNKVLKNRYVSIEHPQSAVLLAKQIIGVAGDRITMRENHVYINNQDYGLIQEISNSGRQLHPITQQEIPEGYVFVYAPHEQSFDSRYLEFGLVKIEQVRESLWPLF